MSQLWLEYNTGVNRSCIMNTKYGYKETKIRLDFTRPPSFTWHNTVNIRFIDMKTADNIAKEMLI